mmetsp:Transcript_1092/g.4214  ORF Transcript_1092/g.4214 Transcript_1092/m.4214 type:complete len:247 (+) Transcript_1092:2081-2821(+)
MNGVQPRRAPRAGARQHLGRGCRDLGPEQPHLVGPHLREDRLLAPGRLALGRRAAGHDAGAQLQHEAQLRGLEALQHLRGVACPAEPLLELAIPQAEDVGLHPKVAHDSPPRRHRARPVLRAGKLRQGVTDPLGVHRIGNTVLGQVRPIRSLAALADQASRAHRRPGEPEVREQPLEPVGVRHHVQLQLPDAFLGLEQPQGLLLGCAGLLLAHEAVRRQLNCRRPQGAKPSNAGREVVEVRSCRYG